MDLLPVAYIHAGAGGKLFVFDQVVVCGKEDILTTGGEGDLIPDEVTTLTKIEVKESS